MTYVIILVVMLAALAPLWHFKPTRRQKKQAKLRETAALLGLYVELRDLPLKPAQLERLPRSEKQVLYYGRRLPATRGDVRTTQSWFRRGTLWESLPARVTPPSIVDQLPLSVLAVASSEASCGVFWNEEGDEDTVRLLSSFLEQWSDTLSNI